LLAAPLLVWLVFADHFGWALWLTIPIAISDWADGFLARRLQVTSRLGAYLDPAADKVLLVVSFISLGLDQAIPLSLVALVAGRDIVIVVGASLLWKLRNRREFTPLASGKISTTLQIATVVIVLLSRVFPNQVLQHARTASFIATAVFTFLSGAAYVRKGIHLAARIPSRVSNGPNRPEYPVSESKD
jgi:cardiolipin synthase